MKRILFVSHDASRTGAPILLLRLIENIKLYSNAKVYILLKEGGPLFNEFSKCGETFIWNSAFIKSRLGRLLDILKVSNWLIYICHQRKIVRWLRDVDIVFNNTVTNAHLLKKLPLAGKRIYSYVHELEIITQMMSHKGDVEYLDLISDKVFVPSEAVKNFLAGKHQVNLNKIRLLRYIIPEVDKNKKYDNPFPYKFIVAFSGTLQWRKGYDLVPIMLRKIVLENSITDVHFMWIGANKKAIEYAILMNDLKKLNLEEYFTGIEPTDTMNVFLSSSDVFVLPSREDAFPLVVLEAATFEVPSICFLNAGGMPEFVGVDAGICVDYLAVDEMVKSIIKLKDNPELKVKLGKRAKEKVLPYINASVIVQDLMKQFD